MSINESVRLEFGGHFVGEIGLTHPPSLRIRDPVMKKLLHALTCSIAALLVTSCFQHEMTINIESDGSGTIVEETLLGEEMIKMIEGMAQLGGEGGGENPLKQMLSENKAKARASQLGEGVTFVKIAEVALGGSKGARATYAFEDVSKIWISTNEGSNAMQQPGQPKMKLDPEDYLKFTMNGGELKVTMPKIEEDAGAEVDPPAEEAGIENEQAMEMAKQMFGDMKMSLKIKAASGIAETDATHKDGNTVTLMEMDFGKLIGNEDNLKKLMSVDQQNPKKAMEVMKKIDGVKFEAKPEISIKLK